MNKALKYVLIFLGIVGLLIVLALIAAAFSPKDYSVKRDIVIERPKMQVFDYIKCLKNQDYYSKWATMDPNMKKTYRGEDASVGFVSAWDSDDKNVGKGEQEIKNIVDGEKIDFELRFIEPFESTEHAYMLTEDAGMNNTKVTWGFDGHMAWPSNMMLWFMDFDQMIGDDLNTGLTNLKNIMETQH